MKIEGLQKGIRRPRGQRFRSTGGFNYSRCGYGNGCLENYLPAIGQFKINEREVVNVTALYEGTRNKLDYVCTKLRNMIDDFYIEGKQNERFTPNIDAVSKLEDELDIVEIVAVGGYCDKSNWKLISKYTSLADELRLVRTIE